MSDERLRELERAVRADPSDEAAREALHAEWKRRGRRGPSPFVSVFGMLDALNTINEASLRYMRWGR